MKKFLKYAGVTMLTVGLSLTQGAPLWAEEVPEELYYQPEEAYVAEQSVWNVDEAVVTENAMENNEWMADEAWTADTMQTDAGNQAETVNQTSYEDVELDTNTASTQAVSSEAMAIEIPESYEDNSYSDFTEQNEASNAWSAEDIGSHENIDVADQDIAMTEQILQNTETQETNFAENTWTQQEGTDATMTETAPAQSEAQGQPEVQMAVTEQTAPETGSEQSDAQATVPQQPAAAEPSSQNTEKPLVDLDFLPLEIKTELPDEIATGEFGIVELKIRNITGNALKYLQLNFWSENPDFVITAFEKSDDAQLALQKGTLDLQKNENRERVIRLKELAPNEVIKVNLIVYAQETITFDPQGLQAKIKCEFETDNAKYQRADTWKMVPESTAPTEEPGSNTEEPTSNTEEPTSNTEELGGNTEEPTSDTEEPGSNTEEPTSNTEEPGGNTEETGANTEEPTSIEEPSGDAQEQTVPAENSTSGIEETTGEVNEPSTNPEDSTSSSEEPGSNPEEPRETTEEPTGSTEEPNGDIEEPTTSDQPENPGMVVETIIQTSSEKPMQDGSQENDGNAGNNPTQNPEQETQTTPDDEEIIKFLADGSVDGEEENTEEEFGYYDDWTTYYYDGGSGYGAAQINTATPHLIVESYSHKKTIHTGDQFPVEITFLNTSQKLGMESVMVQVETSESLSLANGTNTFFVNQVAAGGEAVQRINLVAATQCKEATQNLTLTIKFEYVENNERKEGSTTETITLPIHQMDRLEIKDPSYDEMEVGHDGVISLAYVNKGYTQLNNMEAAITLENADAVQKTIYVGNVESGKNGTIDFIITPLEEGDYSGTITLTYEDSSQQETAVTVPLKFTSVAAYVAQDWDMEAYDLEDDLETTEASLPWIPICAGGAGILAAGIILVVVKKKKAKSAADSDINLDDWFGDAK